MKILPTSSKAEDSLSRKSYSSCLFRIPQGGARVIWEITNTCNYACSYCIFSSEFKHKPNELETDEVLKVIDQLVEAGFTHLKITGGEPFIRPDLIKILQHAIESGLQVDLSTNASLISDERAKKLREMKIPMVHVSLDGSTKELHEKVRGPGTFLATQKGIGRLVENGLCVRIGCVLYKGNESEMESMIQHCIGLGVNEVIFSLMEPVGRMKGDNSLVATRGKKGLQEELEKLNKIYSSKIRVSGNFLETKKKEGCSSCPGGEKFLYINHQGKISPCTWISQYFKQYSPKESLHEKSFSELINGVEIKSYLSLTKSLYQKGFSGCPAQMHKKVRQYQEISSLFEGELSGKLSSGQKFSRISPLYSFTTENIAGYFPKFNFLDKKILTVGGSGDHLINAYFLGASEVVCFDINILSRFYVELKLEALKNLSFEEFEQFLMRGAEGGKMTLSYKTYSQLRKALSPLAQHFFDSAYDYFNQDGGKFRESELFNNRYDKPESKLAYNLYLKDEEAYLIAREKLKNKPLVWINAPLQSLSREVAMQSKQFDIILLSNISDYSHRMYSGEDYLNQYREKSILPLLPSLKKGGKLFLGYVYGSDQQGVGSYFRTKIDNVELRKKVFNVRGCVYQESNFPGVIGKSDVVLTLNKK